MTDIDRRTFSETSSSGVNTEGNVVVQKTATDDGLGSFPGVQYGVVNYISKLITFKPTDTIKSNSWSAASSGGATSGPSESSSNGTTWQSASGTDTWGGSVVRVRYQLDSALPAARQDTMTPQPLVINLTPRNAETIVPGSVAFFFGGWYYFDRGDGKLYTNFNAATGAANLAGAIDYKAGLATIGWWNAGVAMDGSSLFRMASMVTAFGDWTADKAFFRTAGSPIRPASLFVQATAEDGTLITGTSDVSGNITGALVRGAVQQEMGVVRVEFGQMVTAAGHELDDWYDAANVVAGMIWMPKRVIPGTIRYNAVVLTSLPLNADILGLDPVRLPSDGRVPIYRPADVVVIHNTKSTALPNPAVAGATYSVGRTNLSELWVVDANGAPVATTHYAADLAAGTVTMAADLALGATPQPLTVRHRIEELNLLSDVQINGQISLTGALSRDFDADTLVSSALLFGDMSARVTGVFDQTTWDGVWQNTLRGTQATGQFNTVDFPITVLNNGAVTERWRIHFTGATAFQLIGENLGVIATGTTAADLTPANPLTGLPYFTLHAAGWGAGWAAGNQLRFNTIGATAPIWIARTVLPGATLSGDSIDLQLRGDVDA